MPHSQRMPAASQISRSRRRRMHPGAQPHQLELDAGCPALGLLADRGLNDLRYLAQRQQRVGPMRANLLEDGARGHALSHPLAQHRLRGLPKIEFRIELASQALDVEQRLLQQNQLRLHLHVEAPRRLEQAQQHLGEGDLLERLVVDGLADRAHRGLEFVDPRGFRHPAALDMQLRDAAIVAVEEGHEIFRQIMLIARLQGADDAEIHGGIARISRIIDLHEDIAGVHVGMKEIMAEHLREKDLDAVLGQLGDVRAARPQLLDTADDDAVNALHDHDVLAAVVPVNLRARRAAANRQNCASAAQRCRPRASDRVHRVMVLRYSRTTSMGRTGRASIQYSSASFASASSTSRSRSMTSRIPGRSTLTTTSAPFFEVAACTCAMDAAARARTRSCRRSRRAAGRRFSRSWRWRGRRERAARGPAASPAHRRCRPAAGRAASRAPGRTSRKSGPAPRARAASVRRACPRRCAGTRSMAKGRRGSGAAGTGGWRARTRRARA